MTVKQYARIEPVISLNRGLIPRQPTGSKLILTGGGNPIRVVVETGTGGLREKDSAGEAEDWREGIGETRTLAADLGTDTIYEAEADPEVGEQPEPSPADGGISPKPDLDSPGPESVGDAGAGRLVVVNEFSDFASVLDLASNLVLDQIPVGPIGSCPLGAAVLPDGARVLITNFFAGTVSVLDTRTNTVVAEIHLGDQTGGANGVAVDPQGERAYVANFFTRNVSVLDLGSNTVLATIEVGSGPNSVVVSPDGHRVYVTNFFSDSVSVIDTATLQVIATPAVGSFPRGAAIIFEGNKMRTG